ncbi:50S ribosome-binding GTPase family protein [Babesia bovis T2Bo]|uniref:GTPase subfamily protein n=1 Tax=Babesia bovis TaxID=5865 RepID=A7AS80_BABBO|nr:50S ribosome-binding GTPase family protein [Babesia bovis T2Bo]EDO07399.1 50S ribosome-binding GTPase family protein [Babesia bovis T2Bo]|eukprot:XP_001610967.1 GTPase subfamily protein [Babesia bovis T2Bo]
MGGGKNQKGGKHGFIGRTLAHDILARQLKQCENMSGDKPYRQPEYSVVERNSLDEFTMAAEMGLVSYLNTHGGTREVASSDFNSQLARMVNYSDADDNEKFPVVPIPRRCLFFGDEEREAIGRLIKQREYMQSIKDKRRNKRKNKKLVDLYMHGTGPRPVNGVFDPRRLQMLEKQVRQGADKKSDVDEFSSDPSEDDHMETLSTDFSGYDSDSEGETESKGPIPEAIASKNSFFNMEGTQGCFKVDQESTLASDVISAESNTSQKSLENFDNVKQHVTVMQKQGFLNGYKSDTYDVNVDCVSDDSSDYEDVDTFSDEYSDISDDDSSGFVTEEEVEANTDTNCVTNPLNNMASNEKFTVLKHKPDLKYVKEYKKAIEEEVNGIDICMIDANELNRIETKCFYAWRRLLSRIEDEEDRVVTPYEKNIEFWRQLWRVIERSHLLLVIVDARDPLFYRVPDLEDYVKEVDYRKETILILNKADHLSLELRKAWANYFKSKGVDFIFFSTIPGKCDFEYKELSSEDTAYRIHDADMLFKKIDIYRKKQRSIFPELRQEDTSDMPVYTVGCVGYPNVGKSSLINCLMEVTKTNVSCQPGKTKHLQTLALKKYNITLCDCPGLIFPNIVANKHHLLVNSIVSTAHFRGSLIFAVQLICNRIPNQCCERYDVDRAECITINKNKKPILLSTKFLECICNSRKFFSGGKGGQPDLGRAAKLVVKDYVNGNLLYCAWPPDFKPSVVECEHVDTLAECLATLNIGKQANVTSEGYLKVPKEIRAEESKMNDWLMATSGDIPQEQPQAITKRKMRFLLKGKRKLETKHKTSGHNPYN